MFELWRDQCTGKVDRRDRVGKGGHMDFGRNLTMLDGIPDTDYMLHLTSHIVSGESRNANLMESN